VEQPVELARIQLVARNILFREIEQPGDLAPFTRRNFEDLLEGLHLVARHGAVRLGHFGAERDHGHGIRALLVMLGGEMLQMAEEGAKRAAAVCVRENIANPVIEFPEQKGGAFYVQIGSGMWRLVHLYLYTRLS
jgi:hypothetical protein